MPRYLPMCFVLSLALSACAEAGGALATLAVQGITTLGQGVTRNVERDIDAGMRWAGAHDAWVAVYMQSCMEAAGAMAGGDAGDWDKADAAFEDCLDRHVEHMPYTLAGRIAKRVERIKGGKPEIESSEVPAVLTEAAPSAQP